MRQRPLAVVQQGIGAGVEGALTAVAPVAFTPGAMEVGAPGTHGVAVTPGALQRASMPPQRVVIEGRHWGRVS